MKYTIRTTNRFDKDFKRCMKRGLPLEELEKVFKKLEEKGTLPAEYKPHKLTGDHKGEWECHIQPEWLLLWQQFDQELILLMIGTGTHSDLIW
ncbi:MAG: type II toxin-antitoxin system YafQ family toxin [Bacteroidales bacterium]|nr:type II toxin-antitoxin system YafQ family toxin [Bacteroidales bacterium]